MNKKLSYRRDSVGLRLLRRPRSFNVTDLSTDRKPVRDLLLVKNTIINPISHRFRLTAQ